MTFILNILVILGLIASSSFGIISTNDQNNDIYTKVDIDALAILLESHYSAHGEYPTVKEIDKEYDTALPGVDADTLTDGDKKMINRDGSYFYEPTQCSALGCKHFLLRAILSDGTNYTKNSLK